MPSPPNPLPQKVSPAWWGEGWRAIGPSVAIKGGGLLGWVTNKRPVFGGMAAGLGHGWATIKKDAHLSPLPVPSRLRDYPLKPLHIVQLR